MSSLFATAPASNVTLAAGHCVGVVACFIVPAVTLVSNTAGPITLTATSTVQGYGSGTLQNSSPSQPAGIGLALCYATSAGGPWTVFPSSNSSYVEVSQNVATPASTMGYLPAGTLASGSYFFGMCGLGDTVATPTNLAVLDGQAVITEL